jgi:hypothetical protein
MIYTKESRLDLIKKYGLIPDKNGELAAFKMFLNQEEGLTAPAFLVYTYLLLEGGKRNNDTAGKIYYE